jgi:PPE-repeat protein
LNRSAPAKFVLSCAHFAAISDGVGLGFGFGSVGFGSVGFGSVGFGSVGFGSVGFGSVGFGSVGFGSVGFGSVGFGSVGFGFVGSGRQSKPQFFSLFSIFLHFLANRFFIFFLVSAASHPFSELLNPVNFYN